MPVFAIALGRPLVFQADDLPPLNRSRSYVRPGPTNADSGSTNLLTTSPLRAPNIIDSHRMVLQKWGGHNNRITT